MTNVHRRSLQTDPPDIREADYGDGNKDIGPV